MEMSTNTASRGRVAVRRVLAITTVDVMPWILLRPWLQALRSAGYEVHIACARGQYFDRLAGEGFTMHAVALRRCFNPWRHFRPAIELFRLVRRERFDVVNTHSPVAAAMGRVVAWLAGAPNVVYTVHGFYFHDRMAWWQRRFFQAVEWACGRITGHFMFVSDEDRRTAIATGIVRNARRATTIYNGVDPDRFRPRDGARPMHGFVVGIVARIVQEKGYREFLEMAERVIAAGRQVSFLIVGDSLASDRDQFAGQVRERIRNSGFERHFRLTGFTADVEKFLQMMDIFVLPSYREGFPCSILEAMACGLPVVTTAIRGCREAVVHQGTGLIVPPADAGALTAAVLELIDKPDLARRMGEAGRRRAIELFDTRIVQARFVGVFDRVLANGGQARAARA
jgi:glycosyltransferase involved in cell wall biosynthesis